MKKTVYFIDRLDHTITTCEVEGETWAECLGKIGVDVPRGTVDINIEDDDS
jgi:hypothetical protein